MARSIQASKRGAVSVPKLCAACSGTERLTTLACRAPQEASAASPAPALRVSLFRQPSHLPWLHRWHSEITIPAAFMMKSDADVLKGLLATSSDPKEVYVILDWADVLPKANRVRLSHWLDIACCYALRAQRACSDQHRH